MVTTGDPAPDFTVPLANGEFESFALSARLDEAPLVLAFFPAAFSGTCTSEMDAFQERLDSFADAGATVYGVSTDQPFALAEFREARGLEFGLLSDHDRTVVDAYDARTEFESMGVHGLARRAVVVVDADCRVAYRWDGEPSEEPDYDEILAAVAD
jgi:peroxiredoxin